MMVGMFSVYSEYHFIGTSLAVTLYCDLFVLSTSLDALFTVAFEKLHSTCLLTKRNEANEKL